jgi:hypothetical protein
MGQDTEDRTAVSATPVDMFEAARLADVAAELIAHEPNASQIAAALAFLEGHGFAYGTTAIKAIEQAMRRAWSDEGESQPCADVVGASVRAFALAEAGQL